MDKRAVLRCVGLEFSLADRLVGSTHLVAINQVDLREGYRQVQQGATASASIGPRSVVRACVRAHAHHWSLVAGDPNPKQSATESNRAHAAHRPTSIAHGSTHARCSVHTLQACSIYSIYRHIQAYTGIDRQQKVSYIVEVDLVLLADRFGVHLEEVFDLGGVVHLHFVAKEAVAARGRRQVVCCHLHLHLGNLQTVGSIKCALQTVDLSSVHGETPAGLG